MMTANGIVPHQQGPLLYSDEAPNPNYTASKSALRSEGQDAQAILEQDTPLHVTGTEMIY